MVYLNMQPLRIQLFHYAEPLGTLTNRHRCSQIMVASLPPARGRARHQRMDGCPTLFEDELLEYGIVLINSRPYHPQTNGKLERFFRTLEEELSYYDSMDEYIGYYNEKRLYFSLDIDHGQSPLMASADKGYKSDQKNQPKMDGGGH